MRTLQLISLIGRTREKRERICYGVTMTREFSQTFQRVHFLVADRTDSLEGQWQKSGVSGRIGVKCRKEKVFHGLAVFVQ